MLDLDGLKTVNDTLGHPSGDTHIRAFANALRQTVRASDSAYRIGGDEFAISCSTASAHRGRSS